MGTEQGAEFPVFAGFTRPEANYFKVPIEWTNITYSITSIAELKVVEYVLRHTWGFQEFGISKKITLDEFENGRKKKDGSRMDKGTGLCRNSIKEGIRLAVEHGLLDVEEDASDVARIKRWFSLKMAHSEDDVRGAESAPRSAIICPSECHNLPLDQRKIPLKDTSERVLLPNGNGSNSSRIRGFDLPEETRPERTYSREMAEFLCQHLEEKRKIMRRPNLTTWSESFRRFLMLDTVEKERFEKVLRWYVQHIGEEWIPKAFSADTFCERFVDIEYQMDLQNRPTEEDGSILALRERLNGKH